MIQQYTTPLGFGTAVRLSFDLYNEDTAVCTYRVLRMHSSTTALVYLPELLYTTGVLCSTRLEIRIYNRLWYIHAPSEIIWQPFGAAHDSSLEIMNW